MVSLREDGDIRHEFVGVEGEMRSGLVGSFLVFCLTAASNRRMAGLLKPIRSRSFD